MANTMLKCSAEVAANTTFINQANWNRVMTEFQGFVDACEGLNTNNKDTPLTKEHVNCLIHTMTKSQVTVPLADQLYTTGHAMMAMGIQLRIAQHIMSHPQYFADHSNHANNHDDKMKKKTTQKTVNQYLHSTLKPKPSHTASTSSTSTNARRNLLDLLDEEDTLHDLPTTPTPAPALDDDDHASDGSLTEEEEEEEPEPLVPVRGKGKDLRKRTTNTSDEQPGSSTKPAKKKK